MIISNTEKYKDILKYVISGTIKIPEKIKLLIDNENILIPYTYEMTKLLDNKIINKTIEIKYGKINIDKITNKTIKEYLSKKYDCLDVTSSFVDTDEKIVFLSVTSNFEDVLNKTDDGEIDSDETIKIILDGKTTFVKFNFSGDFSYGDGMYSSNLTIKYEKKIKVHVDKQIQKFIKENNEHYKNAAKKGYPYYETNLNEF